MAPGRFLETVVSRASAAACTRVARITAAAFTTAFTASASSAAQVEAAQVRDGPCRRAVVRAATVWASSGRGVPLAGFSAPQRLGGDLWAR